MFGWLRRCRARVVIRTRRDGGRHVRATGLLERFERRLHAFVVAESVPDGTITLGRDWRYRFAGPLRAQEQPLRNWLGAECHVLPPGVAPGRRA